MKRFSILSVIICLVVPVQVLASDLTIGFSWNSVTQPLERAWEDYMRSEAEVQGKAAGVNIKWVFNVADGDPSRQANNIEDLITQGVDIVSARAEDAGAINASIRAAKSANIPFITFDRKSGSVAPTAHVGGDSYDQALTTGRAFADLLGSKGVTGKCIELQGALTDINAVQRTKGWAKVVAERSEVSTITQVPTEWNPELFRSGLANALRANPDANCAFIASDFAITAVQAALEEADKWYPSGHPKHFWLATQDVLPGAVPLMEAKYIDVSTSYDAFAHSQEMVRVAIAIHKGEDPGCSADGCLAKGRVVTPANIGTIENLWSKTYK
ncbi:MAG: sugar ABC transporter substrate-binding protein [Paracoccaceae bacterium]|nr:sugar ABC transporter substrate-binding protein [Paracoccaceae bacterium]